LQEIEELKMTDDLTAYTKSARYSEEYSQQPTEKTLLTYGSKAQEAGEFREKGRERDKRKRERERERENN
jgi:hypothetical protein